jgi:hypothetical protein
MLTARSFASLFGPLYIARMRESAGNYTGALHVIAVVMLVSILLPSLSDRHDANNRRETCNRVCFCSPGLLHHDTFKRLKSAPDTKK